MADDTKRKKPKLTEKQEAFIRAYLETGGNGTEAARRAGFSSRSASSIAHEYLRKPEISARIKAHREKRKEEFEITEKRILSELAAVAFGNINRILEWDYQTGHLRPKSLLTDAEAAYIESLSFDDGAFQLKTLGGKKVEALEKLGKHLGMWKNEDSGNDDSAGRRDALGRLSELMAKRRAKDGGGSN